MSFGIGLSGIRSASTDLEVTGNNIANASTTGFKKSRAEFGDVYTNSLLGSGRHPIGSGSDVTNVRQIFDSSNISGTERALDLAVDGGGFFVVRQDGIQSYTRAGMFTIDDDGYVITNGKARLQGYAANADGEIKRGIISDMFIDARNQPPRLTSRIESKLNLDAREQVLQKKGLEVTTTGAAVGQVDAGILESTRSILNTVTQPTNGGTPAQMAFTKGIDSAPSLLGAAHTGASITIDLGDGGGPKVATLPSTGNYPATVSGVVAEVQKALDDALGSREIIASVDASNRLVLKRGGFQASDGSSFTVTTNGWTTPFGTAGSVVAGTTGSKLFVGSTPVIADFRSNPGTYTTSRTLTTPPLNIVTDDAGTLAVLTANNNYATLDFSGTKRLNYTLNVEGLGTQAINLGAAWNTAPANAAAVTRSEVLAEINNQIGGGALNGMVTAVNDGGKIQFKVQAPNQGKFVQIVDSNTSVGYNLSNLGFASTNRIDQGTDPVVANNQFQLAVTSTTGHAAPAVTITIPPKNYASLTDLAAAIQQQINNSVGVNGLADKVSVEAVNNRLMFTNKFVGSGEKLQFSAAGTSPLNALGLHDMFVVDGQDKIDRSNSFRINLRVPPPDKDNRSGSVSISLEGRYRSVQQVAADINRQLNSQNSSDYIGVKAEAVEVEPKVDPPEFKLRFVATKEGEESEITISNVAATGADISVGQMYGLLQVNPKDNSLLTLGIEGVTNEYPEQKVVLVAPDGKRTNVVIPENTEANAAVSIFNKLPGIKASASTVMTIPSGGYNSPGKNMKITLNGKELTSTTPKDLVDEINKLRKTHLPGFKAELDDSGNMTIHNDIGRDIKIQISSSEPTDSLLVRGGKNSGPVLLGGSNTADKSAAVGGAVTLQMNEGYKLVEPNPKISGVFGALDDSDYKPYITNVFDPKDPETYNHATSVEVFDSLGNSHTLTKFFVREPQPVEGAPNRNVWAMYVQVDGRDVGDPDTSLPFPKNLEPTRARFELFFDQNGRLDKEATGSIFITNWDPMDKQGNPNGAKMSKNVLEGGLPLQDPANSSNFEVTLNDTTQLGSKFSSDHKQNGYATGRLAGLEVNTDGVVFARFSNGRAQALGQVVLANFRNVEGLTPSGETQWSESYESGTPLIGEPKSGTLGRIKSSSLEESNVKLSEELVGLIIAQRNFQASAKTIETTDQVTQAILNI